MSMTRIIGRGVLGLRNLPFDMIPTITDAMSEEETPHIVAASLNDEDFVWEKPSGASFTGKDPIAALFDEIGTYYIHCPDFKAVTELDFRNTSLASLGQLFVCPYLEVLRCNRNSLIELDVRGLNYLHTLTCNKNSIAVLDIGNLTALTYINCTKNNFTELDVSRLVLLDFLGCNGNQLTELDISALALVRTVNCRDQQIAELDFSNCVSIERCNVRNNGMSQTVVDQILHDMVINGIDGGGTAPNECIIDGTNSPPSAAGLVDKVILENRGWTVTVSE